MRAHREETDPFLPPVTEAAPWDQFPDSPREVVSDSMVESTWYNYSLKLLHLLAFLITFMVVLGGAVISKGTLLFMTSQVSHNETKPYCNKELDHNRQFVVRLPEVERVVWIWMLFYAYCVPQVGTFLRSARICCFKSFSYPRWNDFLLVTATETFPSIGSALLVFVILPELDVVKGAMLMNGVCFIPGLLTTLMGRKCRATSLFTFIMDSFATACQLTVFIAWPLVEGNTVLWTIPVALIFLSAGYWENFIKYNVEEKDFMKDEAKDSSAFSLARQRIFFTNTRYFIYIFVSWWKMLIFFTTMILIFYIQHGEVSFLFDLYKTAMHSHPIDIQEVTPIIPSMLENIKDIVEIGLGKEMKSDEWTPVYVFVINVIATYVTYIFGKFACKILIQGFSFAFPINLTMPVAISALVAMAGIYARNDCHYAANIPAYLFFDIPPLYHLEQFLSEQYSWLWLLWVLSQAWITRHIWTPSSERLARTERIFVRPMYDPYLIDQDIALNRRREVFKTDPLLMKGSDNAYNVRLFSEGIDGGPHETTRIYACGTMWHETKDEMMAFLISILRLDADQCARKIASVDYGIEQDYYELETHILFDDAFIRFDNNPEPKLNDYVKTLIDAMNTARTKVHEVEVNWRGPTKYATPYGGRLEWTLPGGTKMIAHLKDKKRIRAKKRWSQVMYMYYILGHRLMDMPYTDSQKAIRSENTFILALDGDIDFQPQAVLLLVDLMKKSKDVGAACGRIHPIGSGPMVWYQIFEYAIGHWLQKATEHVIGCVLCSPGCFSLFRGSALMTDNVMKRYTTESSEARHFVQYDQGEDRWLCTLLLQRGFRVEYSAASDAYTHCPEGFNEFYNQRRRWMPSTTANILDLLTDYKYICHTNNNISKLYMIYQGVMMLGTVLGPGTIFLMLVGAFVAAFQMDQWSSFGWNAVPILLFMAVCKIFHQSEVQLFFAGVLSAIYGLVMMAVLVGVLMQIQTDGVLAPTSLFFFCIAGEFIVTAIMHPKEIGCLLYGVIYYITVPSMYLLLVIYSVFNMNVISWGTRETVIVSQPQSDNVDEKKVEEQKKHRVWNIWNNGQQNSGSVEFSLASIFKCMLCTVEKSPEEERLIALQKSLEEIQVKLGIIEKQASNQAVEAQPRNPAVEVKQKANPIIQNVEIFTWMDDYNEFESACLSKHERTFWEDLRDKYLKPDVLANDSKEKQEIKKNLEDLRDKAVGAFFMINALFVLVVFLLTLKKDILHLKWPFNIKTNFTYYADTREIRLVKEYLELEPIGFVFLIFFGILMVVQFIAMFQHRFETMCQILANMEFDLGFWKRNTSEMYEESLLKRRQRWIQTIKDMQKLRTVKEEEKENPNAPRKTVINNRILQNQLKNAKLTLLDAFKDEYNRRLYESGKVDNNEKKKKRHRETGINVETMERRKTRITRMIGGHPFDESTSEGGIINSGYDDFEDHQFAS